MRCAGTGRGVGAARTTAGAGATAAGARSGCVQGQADPGDGLQQLLGLHLQAVRGGRTLLHQGGVLLGVVVHRGDGLGDRAHACALLGTGRADFAHDVIHMADGGHHVGHGVARAVRQGRALGDLLDAGRDQGLDLLGGLGRTAGQAAHLGRDHGKTAALLARPRGFDGGVQRQDVGLEGDAVDHANDVGNALAGAVDAAHGRDHLLHHLPALLRHLAGVERQLVGLARVVGVLAHRAAHLLHGGSGLLQGAGLFLGAAGQVVVALGDFLAGQGHVFGTVAHALDDVREVGAHVLQALGHTAGVASVGHRGAQVALGHALSAGQQRCRLVAQLAQDAA